MEKEKIWVLTVIDDDGDVFVHLFHKRESAIKYVIAGIEEDKDNGRYASEGAFKNTLESAKNYLNERGCWHDGRNGLDYDIEERELED